MCKPYDLDEISAILGAAYEAFLRVRLERRAGRRGKVHARAVVTAIDMVAEMTVAAAHGQHAAALWLIAIAELDRDRGEIEADVCAHHGFVVPEHEWAAFLEWVGQARAPRT
jgi:hypothetical protein